jgi:hypothetical protein
MRVLPLIVSLVVASACAGDVISDHYATLQDAKTDQLFERGWLPDILPASSRDIHVAFNIDTNVSSGEFHFDPAEFKFLLGKLHLHTKASTPLAALEGEVTEFVGETDPVYAFEDDQATWVFLCEADRGVCEYRMWPRDS